MSNPFSREKSLTELEEETELLEAKDKKAHVEYSLAQKKNAILELKSRGLEPKHFGKEGSGGWDFGRIIQWLKTH